MLSQRAQDYLATLKRARAVPASEVEKALQRKSAPFFEAWRDFHERYAGYIEPLGAEQAVWGIVHEQSYWLRPGQAQVEETFDSGADWLVTCAEVHPSYVYRLGNTGFFRDLRADSFDIKVERNALRWAFFTAAGRQAQIVINRDDPAFIERVRREASLQVEASDRFYKYLLGESVLAVERVDKGAFVQAWQRS
jgi:hypothetical protein